MPIVEFDSVKILVALTLCYYSRDKIDGCQFLAVFRYQELLISKISSLSCSILPNHVELDIRELSEPTNKY